MKKMIVILMILTVGTAVFASGAQEANENGVVELERGQIARSTYLDDLVRIEKTGTVKFESSVPELVAGGKDYTLFAPGAAAFAGYINEGDRISVVGYIVEDDYACFPGGGRGIMGGFQEPDALEDNIRLLVESVEIDGTVYELPWVNQDFTERGMFYGRGMRDSRSGFNGAGNKGGWGGNPGRMPQRGYGFNG